MSSFIAKPKYKILLMLCWIAFLFTGCFNETPSDVQKRIEKGYGLYLPFSLTQEMIYANEWGYIILNLSPDDLKEILSKPIPGFSAWQPYTQSMSIGYKKSLCIDGRANNHYMAAWNYSPTQHKNDKLAIWVDLSRNQLILYDGITSGY